MKIISFVDDFVNSITMYRLVLYGLIVIVVFSVVFAFFGVIQFSPLSVVASIALLVGVCYFANIIFSKLFKAPANVESWLITALILFCIFSPINTRLDVFTLIFAGIVAMGSKYVFTINKKHIFNPAAIAALVLSFNPNTAAVWWVGGSVLIPVVLVVGFLVLRKMRRFLMFFAFAGVSLAVSFFVGVDIRAMLISSPLIFMGTIMLIEPMTTPARRRLQVIYGGIVGGLYASQFNIGPVYSTPELALVVGNIFSYIVGSKVRYLLKLRGKREIAEGIYEFEFVPQGHYPLRGVGFRAGQYLEWTLPHAHADSRGVRRFFTVASSPREDGLRIGVRIGEGSSSFKKRLLSLAEGDVISASQLGGDFVLPDDKGRKLVFIAGGIGVTPFRSMVKYLVEGLAKRDVVLLYFNKLEGEIAYKDIFDEAGREIGLKTVYALTDREHVPNGWKGEVGRLDEEMLSRVVPDFKERIFYISGPNALVNAYKGILLSAGVSRGNIRSDFFAGY